MESTNTSVTDSGGEDGRRSSSSSTSTIVEGGVKHLSELRLVLLGWRWPGKSMTGNTILGREEFHLERAAEFCVKRDAEVCGRQVTVVDTPGWFSTQNTPPTYRQEMLRGPSLLPPGPHAFLLVIPVGMFTEADRACIEENLAQFGERVWRHTLVVFTWAAVLRDKPIERYIKREGRELQWVVEKCRKRYHVVNNHVFGEHPQLPALIRKVEKMVAEEGGHYTPEGAAGAEKEKEKEGGKKTQAQTQAAGNHSNQPLPQQDQQQQQQQQHQNQNQNSNKDSKRDLGARPKNNCSFTSLRGLDVDTTQSTSSQPNK
ncbi:GTPase IMAP family member 4 [Engraulis encrasicolus]|uniref:GTPase IMAP family member 4 n=1 Tax=Engraulis encrasicolus TaxID=184585 RepID=UPI002FD5695C